MQVGSQEAGVGAQNANIAGALAEECDLLEAASEEIAHSRAQFAAQHADLQKAVKEADRFLAWQKERMKEAREDVAVDHGGERATELQKDLERALGEVFYQIQTLVRSLCHTCLVVAQEAAFSWL